MIPAPFEVIPSGTGFTWRLIGACGRALVYSQDSYPSDFDAAQAAKDARAGFLGRALSVDGRAGGDQFLPVAGGGW